MKLRLPIILGLCATIASSSAADAVTASLKDQTLVVFGKEFSVKSSDNGFKSLADELKKVLPSAKGASLSLQVDSSAAWNDLRSVLAAAACCGIQRAEIRCGDALSLELPLPGADAGKGEVVALPLLNGSGDEVLAENGGEKYPCDLELLQGLISQLPKAVIHVVPANGLSVSKVLGVLKRLQQARPAAMAYLPVPEIAAQQSGTAQKAKESKKSGADDARRISHSVGGS